MKWIFLVFVLLHLVNARGRGMRGWRKVRNSQTSLQLMTLYAQILLENEEIFEKDMVLSNAITDKLSGGRKKSKTGSVALSITNHLKDRWPNGEVPYYIAPALRCSGFMSCLFKGAKHLKPAMKEWENKTCIRFRPKRDSDKDWVHFRSSNVGHCAAHVGRIGGEQSVWLGRMCRSKGIILHEIGHMLGFYHEQSRPDRDDYVKIIWDDISKKHHAYFRKYEAVNTMNTPYDYDSIMHSDSKIFKKWYKVFQHSIEPIGKGKGKNIGQRSNISHWDAEEMNRYYNCPK